MSRYRALVQRLGHQRWFAVVVRRVGARLDRTLYRLTCGRLSIAGPAVLPVLLLTTTGRRSGRPRTTPLIYVRDRGRLVASSESFGHARPAAWPLNLAADAVATVQIGATTAPYRGRPATDAEIEA